MQLVGNILIAMPGLQDPRFARSIVLICAHSDEGTMGLIVNKPVKELDFPALLDQLGIAHGDRGREIRVHFGGPVERGRGFVLHSADWVNGEATMRIPGGFGLTGTLDILEELGRGGGPERALLALGYAGWGEGQLEDEIRRNDWLISETPDAPLVFDTPDPHKWDRALRDMGVDPLLLSSTAGRA